MNKQDRITRTVDGARGHYYMRHAQEPDRDETYDARDAANDAHPSPAVEGELLDALRRSRDVVAGLRGAA